MLEIIQESKEQVLEAIRQGRIDGADISQPNFIDGIILKMKEMGVVDELCHVIENRRKPNAVIPLEFIWVLSIAAKMKIHTSLTDIPFKDFWSLEDFKSTKINVIAFHIVCTLLGYLMFQLYVGTQDGGRWSGKSLPVIVKKYIPPDKPKAIIVYTGQYFAVFPFVEFPLHLYTSLEVNIRSRLDPVLALL